MNQSQSSWMWSRRFFSLLPTSTPFVLLQERKREPRVISGQGDGCFLVSRAGRRDDDRVLQSNEAKKYAEDEGGGCGCRWNRAAAVSSPFFTMVIWDEWPVSFDYTIVIHSIQSMLKNSIHSIIMNGPTVTQFKPKTKSAPWICTSRSTCTTPGKKTFLSKSYSRRPSDASSRISRSLCCQQRRVSNARLAWSHKS